MDPLTDEPPRLDLSLRRKNAISWWLASELVRRHPELTLIETHPGGGLYDCLTLCRRSGAEWQTILQLNRMGSAHVTGPDGSWESWGGVWEEHTANPDPHAAVRKLEDLARLPRPVQTPQTGPAALVYRLVARVLAMLVDEKALWDCRNEVLDSSGDETGPRGYVAHFPAAQERLPERRDGDVLGDPAYRFWALLRDEAPVALLETTGVAFVGGQRYDLMKLYRTDRRLFPIIATVLRGLLS